MGIRSWFRQQQSQKNFDISALLRQERMLSSVRTWFSVIFGLIVLSILYGCAADTGTCQLSEVANLPVTFIGDEPTIPVTINGQTLRFMIDTGADITTLTPQAIAKLDVETHFFEGDAIGVAGRVRQSITLPIDIQIGGLDVRKETFTIVGLFKTPPPGQEIDGLLGADILSQFNFFLDFPHNDFRMFRLGACPSALPFQGQYADVRVHSGAYVGFIIPVAVDGQDIQTAIDSGSEVTSFDSVMLSAAGVTGQPIGKDYHIEGIGGKTLMGKRERFASVTIGAEEIDNAIFGVEAAPNADDAASLLGEDYLRHHEVYFSQDLSKVSLGLWMDTKAAP